MIVFLIRLFHILLVFGLLISIFVKKITYKFVSLFIFIYLLARYITGNDRCGLTMLEYRYMKENYQEGFIYRIIKPIITTPENYFDNHMFILHIIWTIILIGEIGFYYYNKRKCRLEEKSINNQILDNEVNNDYINEDNEDIIINNNYKI